MTSERKSLRQQESEPLSRFPAGKAGAGGSPPGFAVSPTEGFPPCASPLGSGITGRTRRPLGTFFLRELGYFYFALTEGVRRRV